MTDLIMNKPQLYTLNEVCELLAISSATAQNWIKTGKLQPINRSVKKPLFVMEAIFELKEKLSKGEITSLNRRRNKGFVTGMHTCSSYISRTSDNHDALQKLLELFSLPDALLTNEQLSCILRDCAQKLLIQAGTSHIGTLLDDLVSLQEYHSFLKQFPQIEPINYTYSPSEDTLGFLYLSLSCLQGRKSSGSYYTPAWLAAHLIQKHLPDLDASKTILDPSCGTGCFLLQLPDTIPLQNIYGTDLNPLSVTLARINLALKYQIDSVQHLETLYQNITVANYLTKSESAAASGTTKHTFYDIILGNPPWGAKLSVAEKNCYRAQYSCCSGSSVEIFDLFTEQSIEQLVPGGTLSFILPESVLTVKSHAAIRALMVQKTRVYSIEYLGEVFDGVQCPSIIFTLLADTTPAFYRNARITTKQLTYTIQTERNLTSDVFSFLQTDEEYDLLQKLTTNPSCTTLAGQAEFALGIVTGNNATLIHKNPAAGLEPILKGSDISKYHIRTGSNYIHFAPEHFQQTASEHIYRAKEKLLYRFINKKLTFAYDDNRLLSLNSCNIVVPEIPGLCTKYILAILNSCVAQFLFEKLFHSVKVLRSHLEQIPIPIATKSTQELIVSYVDKLMHTDDHSKEYDDLYFTLDKHISKLYGLSDAEYQSILSAVDS